jgi:hypothetical protein
MDIEQFEATDIQFKNRIIIIRFLTSNHGFPFLRINLPNILLLKDNELINISKSRQNIFIFSIKLIGIKKTLYFLLEAVLSRFKKKLLEFYFSNKLFFNYF